MSAVQIVEGGYYLTRDGVVCGPARYDPHPWRPAYPWLLQVHASCVHPDVRMEYSDDGHYLRAGDVDLPFDLATACVIGIDLGARDGTAPAAPAESASATPAGGGGGSGEARDGGGASGTEAAITPPPSRPSGATPPPLPGVEDERSAAVIAFCDYVGWSPDTDIMVWPIYWDGYVTYRLGDLVEASSEWIDWLRPRGRLGALYGLMERADFTGRPPAQAGAFTAMADRPFRAVFHPRGAMAEERS